MSYGEHDAAYDDYAGGQADAALGRAEKAAAAIDQAISQRWANADEPSQLVHELTVGPDDDLLFVFTVRLDRPDDFDASDWPGDEVSTLMDEVRDEIRRSAVDDWGWLVTVRATARTE